MMKNRNKFWRWARNALEGPMQEGSEERTLFLDGTIASESWFDDDVTPALFKSDLNAGSGDITVWINSPGGDVFAAAQIYNMLRDYKGKVTVKIDGIAASAASVIAMAGDSVLMSPVSMLMIHNPSTVAMGDKTEMEKAIEMLNSVKDSIINAYQAKTGLSRNKLSKLMDEETWMDSGKAVELHFADGIIDRSELYGVSPSDKPKEDDPGEAKPDEPDEDTQTKAMIRMKRKRRMTLSIFSQDTNPCSSLVTRWQLPQVRNSLATARSMKQPMPSRSLTRICIQKHITRTRSTTSKDVSIS
jgi:ATP-dependent Clp protease protease subunit